MEDITKDLQKSLDIIERTLRSINEEDHKDLYDHMIKARNEIKFTIGLIYFTMD